MKNFPRGENHSKKSRTIFKKIPKESYKSQKNPINPINLK